MKGREWFCWAIRNNGEFYEFYSLALCCQVRLSDIRKLTPEMLLTFHFLHSKVKRSFGIKAEFVWTFFIFLLIKY